MRLLTSLLLACILPAALGWADEGHHHTLTQQEIGSVHFSTSCSKDVAGSFNGAIALLHSFQYEQAREAFAEVASKDPHCAMAYWGIAMSHYHGLWGSGDWNEGRDALRKAADVASSNSNTTVSQPVSTGRSGFSSVSTMNSHSMTEGGAQEAVLPRHPVESTS